MYKVHIISFIIFLIIAGCVLTPLGDKLFMSITARRGVEGFGLVLMLVGILFIISACAMFIVIIFNHTVIEAQFDNQYTIVQNLSDEDKSANFNGYTDKIIETNNKLLQIKTSINTWGNIFYPEKYLNYDFVSLPNGES